VKLSYVGPVPPPLALPCSRHAAAPCAAPVPAPVHPPGPRAAIQAKALLLIIYASARSARPWALPSPHRHLPRSARPAATPAPHRSAAPRHTPPGTPLPRCCAHRRIRHLDTHSRRVGRDDRDRASPHSQIGRAPPAPPAPRGDHAAAQQRHRHQRGQRTDERPDEGSVGVAATGGVAWLRTLLRRTCTTCRRAMCADHRAACAAALRHRVCTRHRARATLVWEGSQAVQTWRRQWRRRWWG